MSKKNRLISSEPNYEVVEADDPMAIFANTLADQAQDLAAAHKISKWDVCVAMANAIGFILADGTDMPKATAFQRIRHIVKVMKAAYELRKTEGSA